MLTQCKLLGVTVYLGVYLGILLARWMGTISLIAIRHDMQSLAYTSFSIGLIWLHSRDCNQGTEDAVRDQILLR